MGEDKYDMSEFDSFGGLSTSEQADSMNVQPKEFKTYVLGRNAEKVGSHDTLYQFNDDTTVATLDFDLGMNQEMNKEAGFGDQNAMLTASLLTSSEAGTLATNILHGIESLDIKPGSYHEMSSNKYTVADH